MAETDGTLQQDTAAGAAGAAGTGAAGAWAAPGADGAAGAGAAVAASVAAQLGSAQLEDYALHSSGRIQAQVSSFRDGLQVYGKVSIVRIRSREANLLIMEDYMPIIGEVDGAVDFIGKDFVHTLDGVRGFFCHDHNVFFLLLKDARETFKADKGDKGDGSTSSTEPSAPPSATPDIISGIPIASAAEVEAQARRELTNV
jgi:hypothetical protein